MPLNPTQKEIFFARIRDLTPAHLSTILASLREPGSQIGTSRNSANHAFLKQLCEWGLARELPLEVEMPPGIMAMLSTFSINEDAKAEIAHLLEIARNQAP